MQWFRTFLQKTYQTVSSKLSAKLKECVYAFQQQLYVTTGTCIDHRWTNNESKIHTEQVKTTLQSTHTHIDPDKANHTDPMFCDCDSGGSNSHIDKSPFLWWNPVIHPIYSLVHYIHPCNSIYSPILDIYRILVWQPNNQYRVNHSWWTHTHTQRILFSWLLKILCLSFTSL